MAQHFTLEYWTDDDWFVGKFKEVPGIFSQGETLSRLEVNVQDAYRSVMADENLPVGITPIGTKIMTLEL